jgi:hypothetical protein
MTVRLRTITPLLAALAAAGLAAPSAQAADPVAVGPNIFFTASVNPLSTSAAAEPVIKVVCPGPITPGETGHPLAGQFVEVDAVGPPVTTTQVGFTGSAAREIDALFSGPSSATVNPPVVLKFFFAPVQIPTTLNLPCGGSGVVSFVPIPTSPTARGVAVNVLYANIAV